MKGKNRNSVSVGSVRKNLLVFFKVKKKKLAVPNISINLTVGEVSFFFLSKTFFFSCKICFRVERHTSLVNIQATEKGNSKPYRFVWYGLVLGFRAYIKLFKNSTSNFEFCFCSPKPLFKWIAKLK